MAPNRGSGLQLVTLCAIASFLWLTHAFEKHSLIDKPRLSSFLLLFISGLACFGASFFSEWLPGVTGRFDDGAVIFEEPQSNLPRRPRRFFLPVLVFCIVFRLEAFHRVNFDLQCSAAGLESFLPLLLISYEVFTGRRGPIPEEKGDEVWRTAFDDIWEWLQTSASTLVLTAFVFTYGVYLASIPSTKSTFFCSSSDRSSLVIFLQWLGLLFDAAAIVLLWRILTWVRATKSRLRTLSSILLLAAVGVGIVTAMTEGFHISGSYRKRTFADFDSLYSFDIVIDGFAVAAFLISAVICACEAAPSSLATTVTFICGFVAAFHKLARIGSFTEATRSDALVPMYTIGIGFTVLLYLNRAPSVTLVHRVVVVVLVVGVLSGSTTYALLTKQTQLAHPLRRIIYDTRIQQDRWLTHAAASKSMRVAVQEYKERNGGRDPPPGFDAWYNFAVDRSSVIVDHFEQMQTDLAPFWGTKPSVIREDIKTLSAEPSIAMLSIQGGNASHNLPADHTRKPDLDELVNTLKPFGAHLADMELAVNLADGPRVLVPWNEVHGMAAKRTHSHARSSGEIDAEGGHPNEPTALGSHHLPSVRQFRHMSAAACPPGSRARSGVHWNIRDFCVSCVGSRSSDQFLEDWHDSTDICHQPDMLRLHGFFMTPPLHPPLQDLLPVFSASKVSGFNDILIPLSRAGDRQTTDTGGQFMMKTDRLFWRGTIEQPQLSHHLLRGGHQERLAHLANNASAIERITMMLPLRSSQGTDKWAYEQVLAREVDAALPLDLGISNYGACFGRECDAAKAELGTRSPGAPLSNRYVLVADTDAGPPPDLLAALGSTSIPFVASVFRTWYSERLTPWLHFVPIDLRFHALHSTLAYFTGLKGRGQIGGRDPDMAAAVDDASWIAEQGRKWAGKAIRREDAEVYLFRLLLEWGRVIDDGRESLGFKLEGK